MWALIICLGKCRISAEKQLQDLLSVFPPSVIMLEVVSQDQLLVVVNWKLRSCAAAFSGNTIIWRS